MNFQGRRITQGQQHFLEQAHERGLLSHTETMRLIKRAQKGDRRARDKVIEHNLLLVSKWAHYYIARHTMMHLKLEDLIQEGSLGLVRAVEKFNPDSGYRFSTYATWWVKQRIRRAIHDQDRTIRLPVHKSETASRIFHIKMRLEEELGREPTNEEIEAAYNATYKADDASRKYTYGLDALPPHTDSIDRKLTDRGTSLAADRDLTWKDFLEDPTDGPEDEVERMDLQFAVAEMLDRLDGRTRTMIKKYYGFPPWEKERYTLDRLGEEYGVTRERARQLIKGGFKHITSVVDPETDVDQPQFPNWHKSFTGTQVQTIRTGQDLSLTKLAQKTGVHRKTIAAIESGREPEQETLEKLAVGLGVPVQLFLPEDPAA